MTQFAKTNSRHGKKKPADGKRQANLSHYVAWQFRVIPHVALSDTVDTNAKQKFYCGDDGGPGCTLLRPFAVMHTAGTDFIDQTKTGASGQRHGNMRFSAPDHFNGRVYDTAGAKQKEIVFHYTLQNSFCK